MIHNLKDGGTAYRLTTYDDPDDGSLAAKIEVQRDGALLVDSVSMPVGPAVQLAAALLRDYLMDHPYDEEIEGEATEIVLGHLDGLVRGETRCCGEASDASEQLALFDVDVETGEVVYFP